MMFKKKSPKKPKKPEKKEDEPAKPIVKPVAKLAKPLDVVSIVKQAIVQVKYEEIGSWLTTHRTPLFYAHKEGFSVVDQKFIEKHPKLKAELDKMVKEITKKKKPAVKAPKPEKEEVGYIG